MVGAVAMAVARVAATTIHAAPTSTPVALVVAATHTATTATMCANIVTHSVVVAAAVVVVDAVAAIVVVKPMTSADTIHTATTTH